MSVAWTGMERRWRNALCDAVLPARPSAAIPAFSESDPDAYWGELLDAAPPLMRFGLRASVWALTFAPILLLGTPALAPGLSLERRGELLRRAYASRIYPLRMGVEVLKLVTCFWALRQPAVRARLDATAAP